MSTGGAGNFSDPYRKPKPQGKPATQPNQAQPPQAEPPEHAHPPQADQAVPALPHTSMPGVTLPDLAPLAAMAPTPADAMTSELSASIPAMVPAPVVTPSPPTPAAPDPNAADDDDDEGVMAALDDDEPAELSADQIAAVETLARGVEETAEETEEERALASVASANRPKLVARAPSAPRKQGNSLKATAVPLFFTVGALLLIPGVWSVLTLAGYDTFGSDRESAKTMALIMLACWPISIILLVTAVFLFKQVSAEDRARKEAQAARNAPKPVAKSQPGPAAKPAPKPKPGAGKSGPGKNG